VNIYIVRSIQNSGPIPGLRQPSGATDDPVAADGSRRAEQRSDQSRETEGFGADFDQDDDGDEYQYTTEKRQPRQPCSHGATIPRHPPSSNDTAPRPGKRCISVPETATECQRR
jgi:hypothetical protein